MIATSSYVLHQQLDIVSAFQSYGEKMYDRISEEERKEIVRNSCPGECELQDWHFV